MIGLFFGSFNPIHVGHLIIADFMATQTDLDQVWIVISPQNPLKQRSSLANDYDRLEMIKLAIEDNDSLKVSDIEFSLPKPSYTIDTMTYLSEKYPDTKFALIMGGDNLATIQKWKNYEMLLKNYPIYLYNRPGYDTSENIELGNIYVYDAPLMEISSSMIRQRLKESQSIHYLVTSPVLNFIEAKGLYSS